MKICFTSIESGIITVGFRKMAALMRSLNSDTEICYVVPTNQMSFSSFLLGRCTAAISESDLDSIARHLAQSDLVAFSSMTMFADLTKDIIARVRKNNPDVFIVWGGIHPIVDPQDAIQDADAICVGEGEIAFNSFFSKYVTGGNYTETNNFWFKANGDVLKNGMLPLQTSQEMSNLPLPLYADNELIYQNGSGFVPLTEDEYRKNNGISYHTVWSIGCPYNCAYCSNSKFIDNDANYKKVRHSPVDYIISEITHVIEKHPYISAVLFHDDSFIGLPVPVLREFADKWKKEVNIGFSVVGALPGFVTREKMEILLDAGMRRVKMGIQTGSDRMLTFYKRPANAAITSRAITIISEFTEYMIPPTYDIILDNPVETRQDVIDSLRFVYDMPRPYSLNIFSLRLMPNTELANRLKEMNIDHPTITEKNYGEVKPSLANILIFTLDIVKLPKNIFEYLLKYAKPYKEPQREFPLLLFMVRALYLFKRGLYHLKYLEFSYFPGVIGKCGYILWKYGILAYHHKRLLEKYRSSVSSSSH